MKQSEKKTLNDKNYDSTVKSLIQRDYFPLLKEKDQDSKNFSVEDQSIKKFTLSSFCESYEPESDAKFVKQVERDRLMLKNTLQTTKRDKELENDKINSYGRQSFSALFYEPPALTSSQNKALTYETDIRKPTINTQNTRLQTSNHINQFSYINTTNHHLFTTESSTTESESDFEGRSQYRKSLFDSMNAPLQINENKIKRRILSNQAKQLLSQLQK